MKVAQAVLIVMYAVLSSLAGSGTARAQHLDVLVQQKNSQLVTGTGDFDHDQWLLGERVFHRDFGATFALNQPGFNSIGDGSPDMPAGAQALPASAQLSWDFLPMTIDGNPRNLFYWNGQDTDGLPGLTPNDVVFGASPGPGYTLSLFDNVNAKYSVSGVNAVVPGGVIVSTASDGSFHQHRFFQLEDGDGESSTKPADGLYLLAMRLRMTGLANSLPVLIVFGTPGSSVSAEDDAAVPWVEQQLNLPGDYNRNGAVDAADYALWRDTLNSSASPAGSGADGDGDGTIEDGDYTFWRQNFGNASQLIVNTGSGVGSFQGLESGSVPEPSSVWLFLIGAAMALGRIGRRSTIGRMSGLCCSI